LSEISITYDLLFDVLRIEKSREELQKLDDKFYANVVDYLNIKESFITNPATSNSERELTKIQLNNVKKLLLELYDRREKKIISLAIYKIKTGSEVINTESLLAEEKYLFESVYSQLFKYRSAIITNINSGKMPVMDNKTAYDTLEIKSINGKSEDKILDDNGIKSVRFIKPVPKFLGSELETYGPFDENDIASLPSKIANILIKKDRAEEMRVN
jgi:DNA replication factor GINS